MREEGAGPWQQEAEQAAADSNSTSGSNPGRRPVSPSLSLSPRFRFLAHLLSWDPSLPSNLLSSHSLTCKQCCLPDPRGAERSEGRELETSKDSRALCSLWDTPQQRTQESPSAPAGPHRGRPGRPQGSQPQQTAGRPAHLLQLRTGPSGPCLFMSAFTMPGLIKPAGLGPALTLMTLLRHSSATILTSDSASSLHSRNSSMAMPSSFWNSGEFLSEGGENVTAKRSLRSHGNYTSCGVGRPVRDAGAQNEGRCLWRGSDWETRTSDARGYAGSQVWALETLQLRLSSRNLKLF